MADAFSSIASPRSLRLNVADRLTEAAAERPAAIAVACARRASPSYRAMQPCDGGRVYSTITFSELDTDATRIARGLLAWGVDPGMRIALLVHPGIEFVTLVFALLRAGVVIVLVDPGLGRRSLVDCLAEAAPDGFVAIPVVQAARLFWRHQFPRAKWNVTVGRRWFWGGATLERLRNFGRAAADEGMRNEEQRMRTLQTLDSVLPATHADDPAAIIFTSGSTGPPKGVLYTQRMFNTQVTDIQTRYGIAPGGVDLSCFPLFALFNSAMGVTTVLPEMDFSRPAVADPRKLSAAAHDWQVSQSFASPAVWRKLAAHCERNGDRIDSLRQIFSCGAPVPADLLRGALAMAAPDAEMHTPYGATECLPVATIEAAEVLGETAALTDEGSGVCVGRKFDSIDWRVIRITDDPIATSNDVEELPAGEIGELVVCGPQASPRYMTRIECNDATKIKSLARSEQGERNRGNEETSLLAARSSLPLPSWHRMGDVGYLDELGRFWYCGRKSQRVETADGPIFTECAEAIFNSHPDVVRTALVGLGTIARQLPVILYELHTECERSQAEMASELHEIGQRFCHTQQIRLFAEFDKLPVDVRHNSKILREQLSEWAKELDLTDVEKTSTTA